MAWYNSNWQYRKKITIPAGKVASNLTDFPVNIKLDNLPIDFWLNVNTNGTDIRITTSDEVTEVPIEIVFCDKSTKTGEVYFKATGTLSSSVDNNFYLYFGNSAASAYANNATYGRNNVWTNGFLAVWHLDETPATGSFANLDSTGNGYDLKQSGTLSRSTSFYTIGRSSIDFGGGYLFSSATATLTQPMTNEAFIHVQGTGNQTIHGNGSDTLGNRRNLLMFGGNQTQHTEIGGDVRANATIARDTWHYVTTTKATGGGSGSVKVYNNGTNQAVTQLSTPTTGGATTAALRLGANVSGTEALDGFIDEARVSNVERSADWIAATYSNLNNNINFLTYGSTEANTLTNWYNTNWIARLKITIGAQSAALTNFPVYVNLANMPNDFFTTVRTDGGDIRITNNSGIVELPRELVSINTTAKTGELYFIAPNLSNTTGTDFYIYWGNSGATNPAKTATYGTYNVWTEYKTVYHFNEFDVLPIQAGSATQNSVANNIHGIILNTPPTTTLYDGPIGKCLDMRGSTNCYLTANTAPDPTEYTLSAYLSFTNNGAITVYNSGTNNASTSYSHNLRINSNKLEHYYFDGASATMIGNNTLSTNTFYHFAGTAKNGGTGYLYVDGTQQTATDPTGTLWTGGDTWNLFGRDGGNTNWFQGIIEELRISNIQKPTAWISAESTNLKTPTSFYTLGSVELGQSPQIQSLTPAKNSTGNAINTNLVLDFDMNVSLGTGNVTIEQIPNLNIGGSFLGDIGEMLFLNNLTEDERQKIEGYLAWKWFGGNNNLPSNHPYKLYAPRN